MPPNKRKKPKGRQNSRQVRDPRIDKQQHDCAFTAAFEEVSLLYKQNCDSLNTCAGARSTGLVDLAEDLSTDVLDTMSSLKMSAAACVVVVAVLKFPMIRERLLNLKRKIHRQYNRGN